MWLELLTRPIDNPSVKCFREFLCNFVSPWLLRSPSYICRCFIHFPSTDSSHSTRSLTHWKRLSFQPASFFACHDFPVRDICFLNCNRGLCWRGLKFTFGGISSLFVKISYPVVYWCVYLQKLNAHHPSNLFRGTGLQTHTHMYRNSSYCRLYAKLPLLSNFPIFFMICWQCRDYLCLEQWTWRYLKMSAFTRKLLDFFIQS